MLDCLCIQQIQIIFGGNQGDSSYRPYCHQVLVQQKRCKTMVDHMDSIASRIYPRSAWPKKSRESSCGSSIKDRESR